MAAAVNGPDSFNAWRTLKVGGATYRYISLPDAERNGLDGIARLPFSLKVLLENLLRNEDGRTVTSDDIRGMQAWLSQRSSDREISFRPARILMQDFTAVPALVDLAAMRDAMVALGGDPAKINPLVPVDLVIDHSVTVDYFGGASAFARNVELEYRRNTERYEFLRWGQQAFRNFRAVPPGTGICHQVNLEFLAQTVWTSMAEGRAQAFPDTLVGTDSHTTMINGLGVLGWGVGGIEAEAAMLGQPISMLIPEVVGFRFTGELNEGVTATDLVLTVTEQLRKKGVVGRFVEFFGSGLSHLALEDRATIANMAPEYGATCGFFPIDDETIAYLETTGREPDRVALVRAYAEAQGLYRSDDTPDPVFTDVLELDLATVRPSVAGPRRPQDRVPLEAAGVSFDKALAQMRHRKSGSADEAVAVAADAPRAGPVAGKEYALEDGSVVVAAITSCTNTSNPSVLIGAGLLARKARERGLSTKPWVKTSLAPGSQVVTDYLAHAGLQSDLDALGFNLVGYGCTTCIGNSGPLPEDISQSIGDNDLVVAAVLSGNRNFEGRINPDVRTNYLASPPLVVAYALAGTMRLDLTSDPLGRDPAGTLVYLRDIWPSSAEVSEVLRKTVTSDLFRSRYANVFEGDARWQAINAGGGQTFSWSPSSTYVQNPPYFAGMPVEPAPITEIRDARIVGLFADSITTDHISPAGSIKRDGPAGEYLISLQVRPQDFNSYGARRGNHEVMMRGTFANVRIRNQMVPGIEGGITVHYPSGERLTIYDAAMRYKAEGVPLILFAGKEYGTGSSRDWAAKGTMLLGVRAVVAESFERIHRSNLVGMGVLPLVFEDGTNWQSLGLTGAETVSIVGLSEAIKPRQTLVAEIRYQDGATRRVPLTARVDTLDEVEYFRHGGILQYVLRHLALGPTSNA